VPPSINQPVHNPAQAGARAVSSDFRPMMPLGDEKYLWVLVILEVAAMFALRGAFKRHHGG
jgi:hypothetical protein